MYKAVTRLLLALALFGYVNAQVTIGSDNSDVSFFTSSLGAVFGISVQTPFYNSTVYPYRLVLDFEQWGGNYATFGTCENIAPNSTYQQSLLQSYTTQWVPPGTCAAVGTTAVTGTYPLVNYGANANPFWSSMTCEGGNSVTWIGSLPVTQLTTTCLGRDGSALFTVEDRTSDYLYSGSLYKTQLVPKNYGQAATASATMYYSTNPRQVSTLSVGTDFVAVGRTIQASTAGVALSSLQTSPDVFVQQISTFASPYNDLSKYLVAFVANFTGKSGSINQFSGSIFLYHKDLLNDTKVIATSYGVLDYGTIDIDIADTSVSSGNLITYTINWTYGSMKPTQFPVSFDLSQGNPYTKTGADNTTLPAGSAVGNYSSLTHVFSFRSSTPGYDTFTVGSPLVISVSKTQNLITSISSNQHVTYQNLLWYSQAMSASTYQYTFNLTAKIFTQTGYNAAVISALTQTDEPTNAGTFTYISGTISAPAVDTASGQTYYLQTISFSTGTISTAPEDMIGNFEFTGMLGQCSGSAPTNPLATGGILCAGNLVTIKPVFAVQSFITLPPQYTVNMPMDYYLVPLDTDTNLDTDYQTALASANYQQDYQQGQHVFGVVTLQTNVVTQLNQFKLSLKDVYICTPNVLTQEITYDGVNTFGCIDSSYATGTSPIFESYKIVSNFVGNPVYAASTSFQPHALQAPGLASGGNDYRVSGYSFWTDPLSDETRTWYIHTIVNISSVGTISKRSSSLTGHAGAQDNIIQSFKIQKAVTPQSPVVEQIVDKNGTVLYTVTRGDTGIEIGILSVVCFAAALLLAIAAFMVWDKCASKKSRRSRSGYSKP